VPVSVFALKDYFSVPTNNLRIFNRILNRSNDDDDDDDEIPIQ
jgi:hypothetical protein